MEPFDLTVVTSGMLEKERLWKRVTESAIPGEGSAWWKAEGSVVLFVIRIVAFFLNVYDKGILKQRILL